MNASFQTAVFFVFVGFSDLMGSSAQEDLPNIVVDAKQVLVPVSFGGTLECRKTRNESLLKCKWDGAINDHVSRGDWLAGERIEPDDLGFVSLDSLQLFEDGKEQQIESVEKVHRPRIVVNDNLGFHVETSITPTGIWSTSDQLQSSGGNPFRRIDIYDFQIAFTPEDSPAGSCHSIRIRGPHEAKLIYRDQYCNAVHSDMDTLLGTPEDARLRQYLVAGKLGTIRPKARANFFYENPGKARVDIAVDFPFTGTKLTAGNGDMVPFSLLISVLGSGDTVMRQSQGYAQNSSYRSSVGPDVSPLYEQEIKINTPVRYNGQIQLPPGEYRFELAYRRGEDFGIAEFPLKIDPYDGTQLTMSSIALCNRIRDVVEKPVAKDFVPLMAGNSEYTPASDTVFHNSDSLVAYFELYEPTSAEAQPNAAKTTYTMRIKNEQTGAVALESVKSAGPWIRADNSTIPVAEKFVLSKLNLAPGKYRFEIHASDSFGRSTPLRTAEFWIE